MRLEMGELYDNFLITLRDLDACRSLRDDQIEQIAAAMVHEFGQQDDLASVIRELEAVLRAIAVHTQGRNPHDESDPALALAHIESLATAASSAAGSCIPRPPEPL